VWNLHQPICQRSYSEKRKTSIDSLHRNSATSNAFLYYTPKIMQHYQQNSMGILFNSLQPGLRQVPPGNLPEHNTTWEKRVVPLSFAFRQVDLEDTRRSAPLLRVGYANRNATTHSHKVHVMEDYAFEPIPIHPDIHNKHVTGTNMRRMQCETDTSFKSFGLFGGISDLSPSDTGASSTQEKIQLTLEASIEDSATICLDQRRSPRVQIHQDDALQRGFDRCSMAAGSQRACAAIPLDTAGCTSSVSPSDFKNTMACSGDRQEEMVVVFDSKTMYTVMTIPTSCTSSRNSPGLRENNQRDPAILNKITTHGLRKHSGDILCGQEPSTTIIRSDRLPIDSGKHSKIEREFLHHDQESFKHVHEDATMEYLKKMMLKSDQTQLQLQEWDKLNGLPKSHSQTMVNSSRSRRQLREGIIIPKWDGTPLINDETELGKPKKRRRKDQWKELQLPIDWKKRVQSLSQQYLVSEASRNLETE
jgi:hypothetical protein